MPALPSFDCYSTLEVSKYATESEIHKAYKRLALVHHPDKNPDDAGATARFQQINTAYATLKDAGLRRRYDHSTSTSSSTASSTPSPNQSDGRSFWGFESDDDDDSSPYSTFGEDFDFMSFSASSFFFRPFSRGVPQQRSEADKQRDVDELLARHVREEEERKKVRAEKLARETEAEARRQAKAASKKAEEESKVKKRKLREAADRAYHEAEWTRLGATTQAEKQLSCSHAEFWTKEQQKKKFKCGECRQKRGMVAFKCPLCALSACQLCRDTFAKRREKLAAN
ncbi:hypothetical protein B0J14DRAFT_237988 [Halenospora varia]|nr:hypothetical protein B0J14DRAFT_237988 [Halenospora varia]